ncbi:MAG: sulfotransferase [Candidatus Altiarchaeota archaeon]|nr:sulfotransferase [Candidatus Altiarchaeota archaeon]
MANIIVSGCPRSGTSMTMRILAAAGLPIATDEVREADKDNLHGYFEVDAIVDRIKENPDYVRGFDGKVLKVIHYGLQYLPKGDYKVVYIERDLDEVMSSMEKMTGKPDPNREETKQAFRKLGEKIKKEMGEREDMDVLYISHRKLLTEPNPEVERIIDFLGIDNLRLGDMVSAIDKRSYRNRAEPKA